MATARGKHSSALTRVRTRRRALRSAVCLLLCSPLAWLPQVRADTGTPAVAALPAAARTELLGPPLTKRLAVVIDDLGYSPARDARALALPGALTVAVLPAAPNATAIAQQASALGREVILHQPMQPVSPLDRPDHGALLEHMSSADYAATLGANLAAVPGSVGINNHRGSLLTARPGAMDELMLQLLARQLYFLDSRTTAATVAHDTAREWGVPTIKRDVFLDHERSTQSMDRQFRRALRIARRQGYAVLIAHPHRESLDYLERALATLPEGFATTRLSDLITHLDLQR